MKKLQAQFFILCLLCVPYSNSSDRLTSVKLIESCKEAISIYETRKAKLKRYAALTTSISEAFQGGYCIGVIESYQQSHSKCYRKDWVSEAKRIANYKSSDHKHMPIDTLLSTLCY